MRLARPALASLALFLALAPGAHAGAASALPAAVDAEVAGPVARTGSCVSIPYPPRPPYVEVDVADCVLGLANFVRQARDAVDCVQEPHPYMCELPDWPYTLCMPSGYCYPRDLPPPLGSGGDDAALALRL